MSDSEIEEDYVYSDDDQEYDETGDSELDHGLENLFSGGVDVCICHLMPMSVDRGRR